MALKILRIGVPTALIALISFAPQWAGVGGASPPRITAINEASNGRTISVDPGAHITMTLHSTYWTLANLPRQRWLAMIGRTTTVGAPPSTSGCVPGQGCGTVTAHYVAQSRGVIHLRATRTSCGEALRCSPSGGLWTVTIRIR